MTAYSNIRFRISAGRARRRHRVRLEKTILIRVVVVNMTFFLKHVRLCLQTDEEALKIVERVEHAGGRS